MQGGKAFLEESSDGGAGRTTTMLKPIRDELNFGLEIYDSLDEAMVDVTDDRIEEARQQNLPFDHFRIAEDKRKIKLVTNTDAPNLEKEVAQADMRESSDAGVTDATGKSQGAVITAQASPMILPRNGNEKIRTALGFQLHM